MVLPVTGDIFHLKLYNLVCFIYYVTKLLYDIFTIISNGKKFIIKGIFIILISVVYFLILLINAQTHS